MEKKAIMIRKSASFMVGAIQTNLEKAGYKILPVDATVAAVNEKQAEADILLLCLGDFISGTSNFLVSI